MPATLKERYETARAEAHTILNTVETEGRAMTSEEQERFTALTDEAKAMKAQVEAITRSREAMNDIVGDLDVPAPTASGAPGARQTPGQVFVNSAQYRAFTAQYPNGVPSGAKVSMPGAVQVGTVRNALLTDPGLTEPRHVIDAPTGVAVMDLMQAITVIDDAPQTIKHFTAAFTNAAAVTAEGVAAPEATLAWSSVTLNMENIPHHLPVTNQALTHNAMLRQIIDGFMVNGVRAKAQAEIATDLAAWSGLTTQAFDTNLRTTLRKAMTKAQTNGAIIGAGAPAIILSAADAETLDLEMLSTLTIENGTGPNQTGSIWRSPIVVVHSGMASGFAYVGDPKQIIWYTSGGINVSVGWVNNQFVEGEQTILATTEGVTGVMGAGALVKAALTV